MRRELGDGYAETLRETYPAVPESADFVMYWWHKAAELVRDGKAKRFGFITTNSLRQTFAGESSRAQLAATPPLSLLFAIPDHPWVDTAEGAAVRIAMTVGAAGITTGELFEVIRRTATGRWLGARSPLQTRRWAKSQADLRSVRTLRTRCR